MSSPGFVFPPPPPPPPQPYPSSQNLYAQPAYPHNNGFRGRGHRGSRGDRGRGRGDSFRGSRGGGSRGALGFDGFPVPSDGGYNGHANGYGPSNYPLPEYPPVQQPQYPNQPSFGHGYPPPPYSPATTVPYPSQPGYLMSGPGAAPSHRGRTPQNVHRYDAPAFHCGPAPYNGHNYASQPRPHFQNHDQPYVMGPPIRLGFANEHYQGVESPMHPSQNSNDVNSYRGLHGNARASRHDFQSTSSSYRGHGQRRLHADAPRNARSSIPRVPAPPAVPSFGNPLPSKPPVVQEQAKRPRKKRKYNQLGLTPRTEDHESSEEDDADEESKLIAAQYGGAMPPQEQLQITYKGQTATLRSSSDIAAWIAERKKRFPTKARAEAAVASKREKQGAERAAKQAHREEQHKKKRLKVTEKRNDRNPDDAEAKIKLKAEKLRKQYERAQKLVAMMEAKKTQTRTDADGGQADSSGSYGTSAEVRSEKATEVGHSPAHTRDEDGSVRSASRLETDNDTHTNEQTDPSTNTTFAHGRAVSSGTISATVEKSPDILGAMHDPLTPTSQPYSREISVSTSAKETAPVARDPRSPKLLSTDVKDASVGGELDVEELDNNSNMSLSTTSSDLSTDDEDEISSSGLGSDEEGPDETGSKSTGPIKVAPARTNKKAAICRMFLEKGRCNRGDACRYRHELPERGSGGRNETKQGKGKGDKRTKEQKTERITLYQRLVAQEKEKEEQLVLQSIIYLGEQGLLNEPNENTEPSDAKAVD